MSVAHRVIKNTGFLYAKMGITMFISLYTTRLVLNSLGAEDFGIFNIVGGAIAMLGFLNASMASATQRFMSYSEGEGDKEKQIKIFNISIVLHFAIALLLGVLLLVAGYFFFNGILNISPNRLNAAKVVYGSLIISTMFTVMTVPYDAVLNAHENMLYYSIVGIIESLLKLGVALSVVSWGGDKLILYGSMMAGIPLIILTIMRVYCHRRYNECLINPRRHLDKALFKEMTKFAGWNLLSSFVILTNLHGQGIVLNIFFGTSLNAVQGITNQLNGQIQTLANNMLKALNPIMGKSAGANDINLLNESIIFGAKYSTLLYLLIAIPLFVKVEDVLRLWLVNVPVYLPIFVRFQLLKSFIEFQFSTIVVGIGSYGKIKKFTIASSFFNFFQTPVSFMLFKNNFQPFSIYISSILFGNIFVYLSAMYVASGKFNFDFVGFLNRVTLPIIKVTCVLFVLSFVFFCKTNMYTYLFVYIFVYFFAVFFGGLNSVEKKFFMKIFKKNKELGYDISCNNNL